METPVTEILKLPTGESKPRPREMLAQFVSSCPGNCGAKFWKKLPPRLEIALHCNEHSRRNVLTAKKAGPVKLPKNKAIHNSVSGRASRAKLVRDKSLAIGVSNLRISGRRRPCFSFAVLW